MTDIVDQPPPKPTSHEPAWPRVLKFIKATASANADPILKTVVGDMEERHELGIKRYGTPLQAGNGRNHLVDCYQEKLDGVAYLQAWFDEHGHDLLDMPDVVPEHVTDLIALFINSISECLVIRKLIEAGH